jgi:hypothetical protein
MKLFLLSLATVLGLSQPAFAEPPHSDYEAVAVSQTDQALGPVGGAGDVVDMLVISVATSATGTVSIKDGSGSSITITPANTPIGVYTVKLGARSSGGAWKVTTGAGATVLAVGKFK